jgi:hypothetical protein
MRTLLSMPFCLCDGRRVRPGDLSARSGYTAAIFNKLTMPRDLVMELCCALHNFRVRLTPWQPMI